MFNIMQISDVMKITKAGQVTVPKEIRDILNTDAIAFEVLDNNDVHIVPIKSVGGALTKYTKQGDADFASIRDEVWKSQTKRYLKQGKIKERGLEA